MRVYTSYLLYCTCLVRYTYIYLSLAHLNLTIHYVQTKELIGDIAPKKLETTDTTANPATIADPTGTGTVPVIGSSWNMAGTFESRDLTAWAKDAILLLFNNSNIGGTFAPPPTTTTATATAPSNNSTSNIVISELKDLSGDAETIVTRGKRKHVCDFTFLLLWSLHIQQQPTAAPTAPTIDPDPSATTTGAATTTTPTTVATTYTDTTSAPAAAAPMVIESTLLIQDLSADGDYDTTFTLITPKNKISGQNYDLFDKSKKELLLRVKHTVALFLEQLKAKV